MLSSQPLIQSSSDTGNLQIPLIGPGPNNKNMNHPREAKSSGSMGMNLNNNNRLHHLDPNNKFT